ncbi:hypothetical protein T4E_11245 [Trichinella pseudospiralis]|uniref:Uncharacterized protein n=1 Tax=Trichinella pseudospiralis TaxID=6337 RepID=A0A0V0XDC2_TRIPS|nr:hypothetical protein T4E_11245 [Trichinella pseudospiralis]
MSEMLTDIRLLLLDGNFKDFQPYHSQQRFKWCFYHQKAGNWRLLSVPQAEAPSIDKEGTLRNTDWLEADRTRKAEVRICHGNKRLTLPIMTRFDDVNKKEQKGATLHFLYAWDRISGRRFLVKTGRAWCCSSQRHPNLYCSSSSQLTTVIKTYGTGRSDQSGYQ